MCTCTCIFHWIIGMTVRWNCGFHGWKLNNMKLFFAEIWSWGNLSTNRPPLMVTSDAKSSHGNNPRNWSTKKNWVNTKSDQQTNTTVWINVKYAQRCCDCSPACSLVVRKDTSLCCSLHMPRACSMLCCVVSSRVKVSGRPTCVRVCVPWRWRHAGVPLQSGPQ